MSDREDADMRHEKLSSLMARIEALETAIRTHRDQRGDDRCWLDDRDLYAVLGENTPVDTSLPPREVFLANCARFHTSRQAPGATVAKGPQGRWVPAAELAEFAKFRAMVEGLAGYCAKWSRQATEDIITDTSEDPSLRLRLETKVHELNKLLGMLRAILTGEERIGEYLGAFKSEAEKWLIDGVVVKLCLSPMELDTVLTAPCPKNYFIGVAVEGTTLILLRGNLKRVMVPFAWFEPSGNSTPDFTDPKVIDHGQTVRLGNYQVGSDTILRDFGGV